MKMTPKVKTPKINTTPKKENLKNWNDHKTDNNPRNEDEPKKIWYQKMYHMVE